MKFFRTLLFVFLIIAGLGIIFRGFIYRRLIVYQAVSNRVAYSVTNPALIKFIEGSNSTIDHEIEAIIKQSLSISSDCLKFRSRSTSFDPNVLITTKETHCTGYAIFYSSVCNYLINKYIPNENWVAKPVKGRLYFLGIDIHQYFDSPFFKNHDFVVIENNKSGKIYAVDPSVNDYFDIDFVSLQDN